jgi:serine protease Do
MKKYTLLALSYLLSSILGGLVVRMWQPDVHAYKSTSETVAYIPNRRDPLSENAEMAKFSLSPSEFVEAAAISTPTVVNIRIKQKSRGFHFWGNEIETSAGSGVIISTDGYIATNGHVVEGAEIIQITLFDKRSFNAELVGMDPSTDLALLRIRTTGLPHIEFANSDSIRVGEWVLAVGNPFNLESTVTAGIVSAKGRSIDILEGQDRIESFIQTDAAVNPGNSGGALVNSLGQLVGINTAIITKSGRYEGYSFAVPANLAKKVLRDLRDYGAVQRGLLGVFIENLDSKKADELGLPSAEGVLVTRVSPGSGADDAGIQKDDVIVRINGSKIRSMAEMQEQIGRLHPGQRIPIEYFRKGRIKNARVVLKTKSNGTALLRAESVSMLRDLGFEVRQLKRQERQQYGKSGVKVISIYQDSKIDRTNMEPGFIIHKVNKKSVGNVEDLATAIFESIDKIMLEGVYEGYSETYYYTFSKE